MGEAVSMTEPLPTDIVEAIAVSADLAGRCRQIVGDGPQAESDWAEIAGLIHSIQYRLLAQVAARAFPDRFRVLGQTLTQR